MADVHVSSQTAVWTPLHMQTRGGDLHAQQPLRACVSDAAPENQECFLTYCSLEEREKKWNMQSEGGPGLMILTIGSVGEPFPQMKQFTVVWFRDASRVVLGEPKQGPPNLLLQPPHSW